MPTNTEILRTKFYNFRNYHQSRLNEAWDISLDEWMKFFTRTEALTAEITGPAGTSNITRIDEGAPWSVDNIYLHSGHKPRTKRNKDAVLVDMTHSRFASCPDDDVKPIVLSKADWIKELKSLRNQ